MSLSKEEIMEFIGKMVVKLDDEKLKVRFMDFNRTLQFDFIDNPSAACYIIFQDGTGSVKGGTTENPEFTITTTTKSIQDIIDGKLSPMRAFMNGKLKSKIRDDSSLNDMSRLLALVD
ncbi:MAG: SCP2 sterol-binding domain-containing protein [Promethearchaeota archaeon]